MTCRRFGRTSRSSSKPVHGKPLVYLDNAATSQKPQVVIDAELRFYLQDCSNVHRGIHQLSERATDAFESTRRKVKGFLNAADLREIIFVRGATEAINLVAHSFGRTHVERGDEVLISAMEHHSNIVPWQILCEEKGAMLRVAPINDRGELLREEFEKLLNERTRLVAVAHVSNALGTINPIRKIIEIAHRRNVPVLVDGAQAAPHLKVDVQALDCDFYTFSGHKMFWPHRHRRALRQGAVAGRDAPLPGRRRHDQLRHLRENYLQHAALQI